MPQNLSPQRIIPRPSTPDPAELNLLVEASAHKSRHLLTGFWGVLLYVLLMTLAVSDEDLLMGHMSQRIPFLDLGLPLLAWFSMAPILVFIFHVDLLYNLHEHLSKLIALREAQEGQLDKHKMYPFFYDLAFAYKRETWMGQLLDWMVWLMVYCLPLSAFLIILIRFGAYQNMLVSGIHFILVILDSLAYWKFYSEWKKALTATSEGKTSSGPAWFERFKVYIFLAWIVFICLWILLSDRWDGGFSEPGEAWFKQPLNIGWYFTGLICVLAGICLRRVCYHLALVSAIIFTLLNAWFCSAWQLPAAQTLVKNTESTYLTHLLPRLVIKNRSLIHLTEDEKRVLEITAAYHANDAGYKKQDEIARQWRLLGSRQDWQGRSLNLANLSGSLMERANLEFAHLKGAELADADLRGALLLGAQLQNSRISNAQLQGAFLNQAHLQNTHLAGAQMQGAKFNHAQLQGANLSDTGLQGTDFSYAQMQGTNLSDAQLQGANLSEAQLQGSNLFNAQMQGAVFSNTQMQGSLCNAIESFHFMQRQGLNDEIETCKSSGAFEALSQDLADKLMSLLPEQRQNEFKTRIGAPANLDETVCGTLTQEMVQTIKAHWNDQTPDKDIKLWIDQGYSCS